MNILCATTISVV